MQVKALLAVLGVGIVRAPSLVEYDIPTPNSAPHCLVAAPDGLIWFAEIGVNKLGRFDPPTDKFTGWPVATVGGRPHGNRWGSGGRGFLTPERGNKDGALEAKDRNLHPEPVPDRRP